VRELLAAEESADAEFRRESGELSDGKRGDRELGAKQYYASGATHAVGDSSELGRESGESSSRRSRESEKYEAIVEKRSLSQSLDATYSSRLHRLYFFIFVNTFFSLFLAFI